MTQAGHRLEFLEAVGHRLRRLEVEPRAAVSADFEERPSSGGTGTSVGAPSKRPSRLLSTSSQYCIVSGGVVCSTLWTRPLFS